MIFYLQGTFQNTHPLSDSRAFRYGDGLFESIRILRGEILFFHDHIQRLLAGMHALKIHVPKEWDHHFFYHIICSLMEQNRITTTGRIRIQVWRGGSGRYTPVSHHPELMVEVEPMNETDYTWLEKGLKIDVAKSVRKAYDITSNIKTSSSLTYVLASIEAVEAACDELLIENAYGKIADTCSGNVFLINKGKIITPSLRDAPVAGVFRSNLMDMLRHEKFSVLEESITLDDVLQADEVFVTNATRGIRPVAQCRSKTYSTSITKIIYDRFNEFLADHEQ